MPAALSRLAAADSPTLYESIAEELAEQIASGRLRPGQKVPSVRRTSAQRAVSAGTIVQAYRLLESRGLIEPRPQSGFYVSARRPDTVAEPRRARPSEVAVLVGPDQQVARVMAAALDPNVVPLGAAFKAPELAPATELARALRRVTRSAGAHAFAYERTDGSLTLRRQLARRSIDLGAPLRADEILITNGASEALHLCLRAVARPGDTLAVEAPAFYGVLRSIESLGLKVVDIPVGADGMDLDALRAALSVHRVRAVLASPTFHNPTGSSMPDRKKAELVKELASRDVPLIEDDIYADLNHQGERPRPAKAWDRKGLVLLCSAFSKVLAPGLRVGWLSGGRFHAAITALKHGISGASATLPQLIVADVLESGAYDRYLRALRPKLAAQVSALRELVAQHFPSGTRISRPQGGYLLWVELPLGTDASAVFEASLAAGICVVPGPLFSPRGRFRNFLRLSAGYPVDDRIAQAVRTVGSLAR